ncbi:hypothetical protein KI387_010506, partial [Taxus chinensis]
MDECDSISFGSSDSTHAAYTNYYSSKYFSWNDISETDDDGPLYHLNTLAATLPCHGIFRRGLSNFYRGKSQSFSCLADVKGVEELAKPEDSYKRKKNLKMIRRRESPASMISKRSTLKASKMI